MNLKWHRISDDEERADINKKTYIILKEVHDPYNFWRLTIFSEYKGSKDYDFFRMIGWEKSYVLNDFERYFKDVLNSQKEEFEDKKDYFLAFSDLYNEIF